MDVYPPSPNWYSPQIIDWDGDTLAYGSRNTVIVLRLNSQDGAIKAAQLPANSTTDETNPPPEKKAKHLPRQEYGRATVTRILCGHKGRVNTVAVWGRTIVSGSDDKTVCLWDVERNSVVRAHRTHKESVSAVCIAREKGTVLSGDKDGVIALWNVGAAAGVQSDGPVLEPSISSCFKCKVTCLKTDGFVAAAGGENGIVVLLNAANGQRIAALEPMNGGVQSLSLCGCSAGKFLSASCGSSVRVWKLSEKKGDSGGAGDDGTKEVQSVASKVSDIYPGSDAKHKSGNGFAPQRCWKSASLYNCHGDDTKNKNILSIAITGDNGEVYIHNLVSAKKKAEKKTIEEGEIVSEEDNITNEEDNITNEEVHYFFRQSKKLPKEHTRPIFGVALHNNYMATHSLDRMLVLWDLKSRRKVWSIGTLGGYVYAISESPVEPQVIYFSAGDNTIRSWNRTDERESNYDWKMRWQGLNAQVTAIDPHPLLPGLVAFGLKDGRVGIYDVSAGRFATASATHKDAVFSLSWRVLCDDSSPVLFSCCGTDGHVFYHTTDQERLAIPKTFELNKHVNCSAKHTAVSWSPDGQYCALGNRDGSITVINGEYSTVCEFKPHTKEVRKIAWGPRGFATLMASCSADGTIYVGTPTVSSSSSSSEAGIKLLQGGHKSGAVNSISFEPSSQDDARPRLVSGGSDGRVLIWDTDTASVVGELLPRHDAPVLTVLWSSSGDFIYSGGEDQTVYEHRTSEISSISSNEEKALSTEPATITIQNPPPQTEKKKKKKKKKNSKEGSSEAQQSYDPLLSSLASDFEDSLVSLEDHIQTCKYLVQNEPSTSEERPRFSRLLLSNREEALDIFLNEASDKGRAYLMIGDTRKYIEISAKASLSGSEQCQTVPTWVLASAFMGRDVLDASLMLYAKQACSGDGDPYTSTLLYLMAYKVPEAIDSLLQAHMFADALALAKARLPRDDPATKRVLTTWARNLEGRKLYIQAAECYLAAQLPDIAVGVLQVLASSGNTEDVLRGKLLSALISRLTGHRDMVLLTKDAGMYADSSHNFALSIEAFMSLEETKQYALVPVFHLTVSELQGKEYTLLDVAKELCATASKYGVSLDSDVLLNPENDEALDKEIVLCVKALVYMARGKSAEAENILAELKEAKSGCVNDFLNKVKLI